MPAHMIRSSLLASALLASAAQGQGSLFNMEEILDPTTLDVEVLQDWHVDSVNGTTRQKLIEITVAEWWEGATYRVPVRIIIPLEGTAEGFAITGGAHWDDLMSDISSFEGSTTASVLAQGAASVLTVVQPLWVIPTAIPFEQESYARWAATGNGRYTDIWLWSMTHMRAVTAVLEEDLVEDGRILGYGTSKNGGTPAVAIMHDDRYTGLVAEAASAYYAPIDRRDPETMAENQAVNDWFFDALDSGEIDPGEHSREFYYYAVYENPLILYMNLLETSGWEEADIRTVAEELWGQCALSAAIDDLQLRGTELLFEAGTHDWVADDLAWGGKNHPEIQHYYMINAGHGQGPDRLLIPAASRYTRLSFIERHFGAPHELLETPQASYEITDGILDVTVVFTEGPNPDTSKVVWMDDRHPCGTAPYLWREYELENTAQLEFDPETGAWTAEVQLPEGIQTVDVFTDHRRSVPTAGRDFWVSSPFTRIELDGDEGIPGDFDGDGLVTGNDLTILLGSWGPCESGEICIADINGDGTVNGADLTTLLGNWSQTG